MHSSAHAANTAVDLTLRVGRPVDVSVAPREAQVDKTETVLVVDDEPVVRHFIRAALASEGYTVPDANAYHEAIAICEGLNSETIHLLILDHGLSSETGKASAWEILRYCPNAKVLIISGWPFEVVEQQGGLIPGAEFLPKPFTCQALKQAVGEILARCEMGHSAGSD
jgi:DNA-binding response OmpR family regulator